MTCSTCTADATTRRNMDDAMNLNPLVTHSGHPFCNTCAEMVDNAPSRILELAYEIGYDRGQFNIESGRGY